MGLFGKTRVFGFLGHKSVLRVDSKGNLSAKLLISAPGSADTGSADERLYVTANLSQLRRLLKFASAGDKLAISVQLSNIVLEAEEGKTTKNNFLSAFMRDEYDDRGNMTSSAFNVVWNRSKSRNEVPQSLILVDKEGNEFPDLDSALVALGLSDNQVAATNAGPAPIYTAGSVTAQLVEEEVDDLPF